MAVNYLPTGLEDLGPVLGNLGQNLALLATKDARRKRMFQDMMLQHPEVAAHLGSLVAGIDDAVPVGSGDEGMATQGRRREALDDLSRVLGIAPDLLASTRQFYQPTADEQVQRQLAGDQGYIQQRVAGAREEAAAATDVARAQGTQARDLIHLSRVTNEQGLIELRANTEVQQLRAQGRLTEADMRNLDAYEAYANAQPPEVRGRMALALRNPNYLTYLAHRERMQFEAGQAALNRQLQERLANIRQAANPIEQARAAFEFDHDIQGEMDNALKNFNAATEAGDKDQQRLWMERFNTLSATRAGLSMNAPVSRIVERSGVLGTSFEVQTMTPTDPRTERGANIERAAQMIVGGQGSLDAVAQGAPQFWAVPENRQALTMRISQLRREQADRQAAEVARQNRAEARRRQRESTPSRPQDHQ